MDCDEVRLIHQKLLCQTFQQRPFYPVKHKCMTILTLNCYLLEGKLAHNKASAKIFYKNAYIHTKQSEEKYLYLYMRAISHND